MPDDRRLRVPPLSPTGKPRGPASWFAGIVVRLRFPILVFWILAAVAATILLPTIDEAGTGALGELVATDAEAIDAEIRSNELFRFPLLSRTLVVQRDPDGLSPAAQARVLRRAALLNLDRLPGLDGIALALPVTNTLGRPPFSRERSTTAITYLFFPTTIGRVGRVGLARRLVERHVNRPDDGLVGITGAVPARNKQVETIRDALPLVELATVFVVIAAMALHFRALGAPLLNVLAIAIAFLVATRVVAVAGTLAPVSVPSEAEPVMVALLFGAITDYSIFFVSRFKRRLAEGMHQHDAARECATDLVPIVTAAGLTIAGATAALVVARLGFYQAFGPGLALATLVALAVSVTFVPAALAVGGGRLLWPSDATAESRRSLPNRGIAARVRRARANLLGLPVRRPRLAAALAIVPLLIAATGLFQLEVGNTIIRGLSESAEPRQALRAAGQGFAPGILSPTVVIVEAPGITRERTALARLQRRIERRSGVAAVVGPAEQPVPANLGAVLSPTGDAVRYFAVLNADPLGSGGIAAFERLRRDMRAMLRAAGLPGAEVSYAGDTALSAETVRTTESDLKRLLPATALIVFAILAVFLRALVAPAYLVLASLLALAASLGLTVYIFQGLLGYGELTFYVPFAATVLLVALGSDYNVYLVGRVWSEARRRPLRQAVAVAGGRAAAAITVAALVLSASFALLALVPLRPFRELAFAMSAGLLLDAFLVRTLLAPAMITLVGERSGWPGRRLTRRSSKPEPAEIPSQR